MNADNAKNRASPAMPGTDVVPQKAARPNPQGKGLVGLLDDWTQSQPRGVVAKRPAQLLADYFTSLLVLSSSFGFRPVRNKTYHLYFFNEAWSLSLVSPAEWNCDRRRDAYAGACVLHEDATWSIDPSESLGQPGPVSEALADAYRDFVERLDAGNKLGDSLPVYERSLPYVQRMCAAALGRSLGGSMRAGGQDAWSSDAWLEALPGASAQVLSGPEDSQAE